MQAFCDDSYLVDKGLRNYWGYSTLSYFAPENRYLGSGELGEISHDGQSAARRRASR